MSPPTFVEIQATVKDNAQPVTNITFKNSAPRFSINLRTTRTAARRTLSSSSEIAAAQTHSLSWKKNGALNKLHEAVQHNKADFGDEQIDEEADVPRT